MIVRAPETCPHCGARCDSDQTSCFACGEDVVAMDPAIAGRFHEFEGPTDTVPAVAFLPDGKRVLCAHSTSLLGHMMRAVMPTSRVPYDPYVLCVWDLETGAEVERLCGSLAWISDVVCSPDGRVAISAGWEDSLRVWDLTTGRASGRIQRHRLGSAVDALALSPDGRVLCSGGADRTVRFWDVSSGVQRHCAEGHGGKVHDVAFSSDGNRVVTASADGTARVLEPSGKEVRRFTAGTPLRGAAFMPEGQHVITGGDDATLRMWDVATGAEVQQLKGHAGAIQCLAVSPDGRRVVSGDKRGVLRLWDVRTGVECARADKHAGPSYRLEFSPDGRRVVSGGNDAWVCIWELPKVRMLDGTARADESSA